MKKAGVVMAFIGLCISATALIKKPAPIGVDNTLQYFHSNTQAFISSLKELQSAIKNISDKHSVELAKCSLRVCRKAYKKLEFFIEYFFEIRIRIFNGAPVYEVEEPYLEYQSPVGFQVMEALLFDDKPENKKTELLSQTDLLLTTANGLGSYLYQRELGDDEILESMRLELIRIITLGITGYDAPQLKSGIEEGSQAMVALQQNLLPYLNKASAVTRERVEDYLNRCNQLMLQSSSFDKFNRLQFLTEAALPLQEQLNTLIKELHLEKNGISALNYDAANIYSKEALNITAFTGTNDIKNTALIALGKELFFEKQLSGNSKISCATCHQPQHYFTDAKNKSIAFDGHTQVSRNAPSLFYAAYQHHQFWDGRATSLEDQIEKVLFSKTEMNAGGTDLTRQLKKKPVYEKLLSAAFKEDNFSITKKISIAIAAYECSLPVMTSPFDSYMMGNKKALSSNQVQGFNLFMGKAKCGTCHFAPVFNSLLPPAYNRTEFESLGMVSSPDFKKPKADKDNGRYAIYPIEFYKGVFKTPTVRNSAKTAPYMHNGVFKTLAEVIEFYDKGGGNGLHLGAKNQTLADKPLHLTAKEKTCLISFLHSLTDKPVIP